MGEPRISRDVAILIANGLVAGMGIPGVDLNLYRVEAGLDDRNRWKVEFKLKERYIHFNVRCATVWINSGTGEVVMHQYPDCNEPPVIEHATKAKRYSLPDGSTGIYVGAEGGSIFEIAHWEWEALFWDELGATDPNYAPHWEKVFRDSIPDYPTLAEIRGEYGSKVTFGADEIDVLMKECIQIAKSAKNPIALDVVTRILTACELSKASNVSMSFVGD
jgi:hypothetical protein